MYSGAYVQVEGVPAMWCPQYPPFLKNPLRGNLA